MGKGKGKTKPLPQAPAVPSPNTPGALIVSVFDQNVNPIPGATARLHRPATNDDVEQTTNTQGQTTFTNLPPRNDYGLLISKKGFGRIPDPGQKWAENALSGIFVVNPGPDPSDVTGQLRNNKAKLGVKVIDATTNTPLGGANVGIDGTTGTPAPLSKPVTGLFGPVEVDADVEIRVHADKFGFGPLPGGTPFGGVVDAKRTLTFDQTLIVDLLLHQAPLVTPSLDQAKRVVVLKKAHTNPARQKLVLSCDVDFDGTGKLTITGSGAVKAFDLATNGTAVDLTRTFTGAELRAGFTLFLEGVTASSKMDGLVFELVLSGGTKKPTGTAKTLITVVDLTLDLCQSRTSATADPTPLSEADKIGVGRFVHRQINNAHGRAKLVVKELVPKDFSGTLVLSQLPGTAGSGGLSLFDKAAEVPTGQAALAASHEFAASTVGSGLAFFAEGASTSGAVRDTGYRLGIKGVEDDVDHVKMTVVEFSHLKVDVPFTPAKTARLSNTPVRTTFELGATFVANAFKEDFDLDNVLILISNSVTAADPVKVSVQVKPAGVPVAWSVRRDTRPAPNGDAPGIKALTPAMPAVPTLSPVSGSPLSATLTSDANGSFHMCAYVDCNGDGVQDFNDDATGKRIDREPFILMGLILVRVQGFTNTSRAQANSAVKPAAPTSATGVSFSSGKFTNAAAAAVHNTAIATVVGGGRNGKLGLDRVFAGWSNNVTAMNSVASYVQTIPPPTPPAVGPPGGVVTHAMTAMMASNTVAVTSGTVSPATIVTRFVPAGTVIPPGSTTTIVGAPTAAATPALDVSPHTGAGTGGETCCGTEGPNVHLPVKKQALPRPGHSLALGEDWTVEMFDSPGFGAGRAHPAFPGVLRSFSFNVDFSCDLVFWTNVGFLPGVSTDPACTLYAQVQNNTWRIRFDIAFNAATGAGVVGNQRSELTSDPVPTKSAAPIVNTEVRFPTALAMWAQDART